MKTIQKWNGIRAPISREFIEDFRTYLEGKIAEQELEDNNKQHQQKYYNNNNSIEGVEKLLQTPIAEYRKELYGKYYVTIWVSNFELTIEIDPKC